jgi:hypothetical protein
MFGQKITNTNEMLQCRTCYCADFALPKSGQLNEAQEVNGHLMSQQQKRWAMPIHPYTNKYNCCNAYACKDDDETTSEQWPQIPTSLCSIWLEWIPLPRTYATWVLFFFFSFFPSSFLCIKQMQLCKPPHVAAPAILTPPPNGTPVCCLPWSPIVLIVS